MSFQTQLEKGLLEIEERVTPSGCLHTQVMRLGSHRGHTPRAWLPISSKASIFFDYHSSWHNPFPYNKHLFQNNSTITIFHVWMGSVSSEIFWELFRIWPVHCFTVTMKLNMPTFLKMSTMSDKLSTISYGRQWKWLITLFAWMRSCMKILL